MSRGSDAVVLTVAIPRRFTVVVQGILTGEDGLATMRGRGEEVQELWTVRVRLPELRAWVASLPADYGVKILGERVPGEE